jgi:hypothetical protein
LTPAGCDGSIRAVCTFDWDAFAKVVTAFAPYTWPAAAVFLALSFRGEVAALAKRITKAWGVELAPAAQELATLDLPTTPSETLPELPSPAPTATAAPAAAMPTKPTETLEEAIAAGMALPPVAEQISNEAGSSAPELALMALAIEFEQELRAYAIRLACLSPRKQVAIDKVFAAIQQKMPRSISQGARTLLDTRNQLMRGMRVREQDLEPARRQAKLLIDYFRSHRERRSIAAQTGP